MGIADLFIGIGISSLSAIAKILSSLVTSTLYVPVNLLKAGIMQWVFEK